MIYAALLRGINVGGKNKVDMKRLKSVFEEAGMTDVRTYINSGNVIFSTKVRSPAAIVELVEREIEKAFGFRVPIVIRDIKTMRETVKALGESWSNDQDSKCDVLFLWKDVDRRDILDQFTINAESEDLVYAPGAVIWRTDRDFAPNSKIFKVVATPLYKQMTIRNCNTVRKLLALMEENAKN